MTVTNSADRPQPEGAASKKSGERPDPDDHSTVIEALASRVNQSPGAVAVRSGALTLTYAELWERAGQVSELLAAAGTTADSPVGVLLSRSADSVVALLSVMRRGGAYLPLAPDAPLSRNAYILDDAQVGVLLLGDGVEEGELSTGRTIVRLPSGALANQAPARQAELDPASLAYVIYTSGSTGVPKGVAVEHRALLAYCRAAVDRYGLTPRDVVLQTASLAFDASIEEILPTLLAGGTVTFAETSPGIAELMPTCAALGVTVLNLPTAYWHAYCAVLSGKSISRPVDLRLVIIGGEEAKASTLTRWRSAFGATVRLLNTYGPSETTVVVSVAELTDHVVEPAHARLPIGLPLGQAQLRVVGPDLSEVSRGSVGELLVGGPTVARGYLGAAAGSDRFLCGVDDEAPHARFYRTGDLVYERPDGQLVFYGRSDRQVKLGGYRVELQEVEQAVLGHHDVLDCRVEVEDLDIGQRLVCFVRLTQDGADFQDIRQSVGARLPQYMVPARWVSPESWPTTVNGKIDVAALLAAHPAADPATPVPHARSEDDLSRVIAAWCSVLSLPDAGVDDNLFEVGGNSLRAALIAMRLQRATGVELSVVNVLANPSPRSLADLITAKRASRPGAERPQLQAVAAARLETHPSHAAR